MASQKKDDPSIEGTSAKLSLMLKNDEALSLSKRDSFSDIEEQGGVMKVLTLLEAGTSYVQIAKALSVPLMHLRSFIMENLSPEMVEAATTSLYDAKFDAIAEDAASIESDHRRVRAMLEVNTLLASRETTKYRDKFVGGSGPGVHININWGELPQPKPFTIEQA
jgi:hypothetical protein